MSASTWERLAEEQAAILDALPVATGLVRDGRIAWVNRAFTTILGYGREEALNQPTTVVFVDPRHRDRLALESAESIAGGDTYQVELLLQHKDGSVFWGSVTGRLLFPQRTDCGVLWTLVEISKHKRDEETIRLTQERLEVAQAQAKIGSWELGPNFEPRYWSKQIFELFGLDAKLGPPVIEQYLEHVHPEDREAVREAPERARRSGTLYRLTYRGNPQLGCARYLEATFVPEYDEQGRFVHMTGTTQDVSERKLAADALRDSEQRLQRLLENSNDLIALVDAQGRQRSMQGPVTAMLGYQPAELEGVAAIDMVHPDDVASLQATMASNMAHPGVPFRVELRFRHKTGTFIDMEGVGTNWLDDPVIRGTVVNLRQITARKRAEQERDRLQGQLQQALKMEAVGRLAGGIAHDFNNLITAINGNVELALGDLDPRDPLTEYLMEVTEAANSAAALTGQLLAFSRRQLIQPKMVNLNDHIGKLQRLLQRLIGEDIVLELNRCAELGAVRIDPGQFDQVIVNLAVNARDAMPKGGRLTIETSNVELDEEYCRTHDVGPGPYVMLGVSDEGAGMPREVIDHIFEPFFTTKPEGAGTGLGLCVIYGVVKQAGGTIETYSELGHGTCFKIYLPRVDAPVQKLEESRIAIDAPQGTETILLVEDNDSVRELTAKMLRRLGYHVLVAGHGKAALALIQDEGPAIDLLLTDLVMPEMSGRELSEQIRALPLDVPVLYCSGYTEDAFVRHGLATENLHFIGKPFTLHQLGVKVRQVLDERRR